ncbi:unnamed protein product [Caenorhabditis brenneri]
MNSPSFAILFFILLFADAFHNETFYRGKRGRGTTAPKEIISSSLVKPSEDLFELEELNSRSLSGYIGSLLDNTATKEEEAENARKGLEFLAKYSIIPNSRVCDTCGNLLSLSRDPSVKHEHLVWRCAPCRRTKTSTKMALRSGTFFENLKMTIQELLFLAADWIESPEKPIRDVATQMKLNAATVVEAHEWFRQMTRQWFERESVANKDLILGGPGKYVEIDETLMYKAKYNRGNMLTRPQVWVFGMIERGSPKVMMFRVERRDAATLLPLIHKYVAPGTNVISDGWAAYGGIGALQAGFNHQWVNHKLNFVDPDDPTVHTQSIEATWGAFKRKLKSRFGDPEYRLQGHMFQYMWRRFYEKKKLLNRLMYEMKFFRRGAEKEDEDDGDAADGTTPAPVKNVANTAPAVDKNSQDTSDSDYQDAGTNQAAGSSMQAGPSGTNSRSRSQVGSGGSSVRARGNPSASNQALVTDSNAPASGAMGRGNSGRGRGGARTNSAAAAPIPDPNASASGATGSGNSGRRRGGTSTNSAAAAPIPDPNASASGATGSGNSGRRRGGTSTNSAAAAPIPDPNASASGATGSGNSGRRRGGTSTNSAAAAPIPDPNASASGSAMSSTSEKLPVPASKRGRPTTDPLTAVVHPTTRSKNSKPAVVSSVPAVPKKPKDGASAVKSTKKTDTKARGKGKP